MKLLLKNEASNKIKKANEELVDANIRLRGIQKDITTKIRTAKVDYTSDKAKALKEFDDFCRDLNLKKSKLLEELNAVSDEIEKKKEIYYGLITKQDELEERIYQTDEKEKRINLREAFISDLENKWKMRTVAVMK